MIAVGSTPGLNAERGLWMKLETFGDRLFWARRTLARLTQQKMRDRMQEEYGVEIGRNYVSLMETDATTRPTFEVVRAAAGVCGVSLDYLAGFTETAALGAAGEEPAPEYFSPEADEMARLVDGMSPAQRTAILSVAHSMVAPTQAQRDRAEAMDILRSIEDQFGAEMRREVERIIRGKRLPVDPAS